MPTARELANSLQQERKDAQAWIESHSKDGQLDLDDNGIKEFHERNDRLEKLTVQWEEMDKVEKAAIQSKQRLEQLQRVIDLPYNNMPGGTATPPTSSTTTDTYGMPGAQAQKKGIGEAFTDSDTFKSFKGDFGSSPRFSVDLPDHSLNDYAKTAQFKTTLTEATGFAPFSPRLPIVVPYANRRLVVADLMPNTPIQYAAVIYMQQTTQTNNAATVSEGATKPESALAWTQQTANVQVIAHMVPITLQLLEDVPRIQSTLENQMTYMLQLAEEVQILSGNGSAPNLQGLLTATGLQTQAKGADPIPTAIMKAFTLIRGITPGTGFAEPSGVVMHPTDYTTLVTLQTSTGAYLFGDPSSIDGVQRIWGKPIVVTPAMTLGTTLVGDFAMYAELYRRSGIRVDVSDSYNDDFAKNLLRMRVEERVALADYRPSAFATVTGL